MRIFTTMLAAGLLAIWAPVADAAEASAKKPQQSGPLKPGRSAGIRGAQLPRTGLALVGASAIIAVIVVAAGTGGGSGGNGPQSNFQSVPTTTTN
ncbi:MAG TPA: hypothetical protein VH189_04895 [Rhizomicrobium sp.]|jgi:hypothetical protein|nr:hypothetical protein [Rhizomicrobium sp.]